MTTISRTATSPAGPTVRVPEQIHPATGSTAAPTPTAGPDKRIKALRRFALSITAFTVLGHLFLGFEQSPITPLATVLLGYSMEIGLEVLDARLKARPLRFDRHDARSVVNFLLPAHISALAVAMLLYAGPVLWPYLLGTAIAISAKYVILAPVRGKLRHVMNPSNLGIALVLILFPWVGIAPPYQFTANVGEPFDWLVVLGIVMLGTMLNAKLTGKMPLILGWVGGFAAQAVLRDLIFGHSVLAALAPITGVAFVLFTNYMITDPGTTPVSGRNQIIFGVGCAAVYGVLVICGVSFGLFFALVITCAIRAILLWVSSVARRSSHG